MMNITGLLAKLKLSDFRKDAIEYIMSTYSGIINTV